MQTNKRFNLLHLWSFLSSLLILALVSGCGSHSCSQDYPPPWEITTNENPYHLSFLTSDFEISSARWKNITTGDAGISELSTIDKCVFPLGCATWLRIDMDVPLITGENLVYVYEKSGHCEFRSDYLITYDENYIADNTWPK